MAVESSIVAKRSRDFLSQKTFNQLLIVRRMPRKVSLRLSERQDEARTMINKNQFYYRIIFYDPLMVQSLCQPPKVILHSIPFISDPNHQKGRNQKNILKQAPPHQHNRPNRGE